MVMVVHLMPCVLTRGIQIVHRTEWVQMKSMVMVVHLMPCVLTRGIQIVHRTEWVQMKSMVMVVHWMHCVLVRNIRLTLRALLFVRCLIVPFAEVRGMVMVVHRMQWLRSIRAVMGCILLMGYSHSDHQRSNYHSHQNREFSKQRYHKYYYQLGAQFFQNIAGTTSYGQNHNKYNKHNKHNNYHDDHKHYNCGQYKLDQHNQCN
jgi:hypothetical protein